MNDIMFAKAHTGEYFQWLGRKVRVIGYDATGSGASVIVDSEGGWSVDAADPTDVIMAESRTGRCEYVYWEDLK
jgi:hypothetical protein